MKKTNYSYIGIAFIILVFGIWFIPKIVNRVSNDKVVDMDRHHLTNSTNEDEGLAFLEIDGEKKEMLPFSFVDQNGDTISNENYKGKVYVVEFFFTTCPTICPRMNRNMVEIQNAFKDYNDDFGIASFTINPEHDTPEVLKEYADKYGVTNPNWHFMTGTKEEIYKLANEGFNLYTAQNDEVEGGFEHSGNFALIDKKGYIRSRVIDGNPIIYYNGMISENEQSDEVGEEQEITMLKEDIQKLLKE